MKKVAALFFALLWFGATHSQDLYKEGHFITNNNEKVECFILDRGWSSNPKLVSYRITLDGKTDVFSIDDVSYFEIKGGDQFLRKTILLDKTVASMRDLSVNPKSKWEEETLFLRKLLDGHAQLYYYSESHLQRFFAGTDTLEPFQLEYKPYMSDKAGKPVVLYNKNFIKQLQDFFPCDDIGFKRYLNIEYNSKDLIDYFRDYNECKDPDYLYEHIPTKTKISFAIKPGFNISNVYYQTSIGNLKTTPRFKYGFSTDPRIGIELEIIPPRLNNILSLFLEPNINFRNKTVNQLKSNYYYFSQAQGARVYEYYGLKHSVFFEAMFVYDFPLLVNFSRLSKNNYAKGFSAGVGFGYKFDRKYSIQYRLMSPRNLLAQVFNNLLSYNTMSVIFGYTF